PVVWNTGKKTVVISNGRTTLSGVDLHSGELLWSTPGGGDCTPAIVGDRLAVQTSDPKIGIMAGKLTDTGFKPLWNYPYHPLRAQASPLIIGEHLYLMDDNIHWCFELASGRQCWREKATGSSITSPIYLPTAKFSLW
ncbi:MAG: PQQ-like beta-propeller repeat protein, partial [Verrucomicrobiae bacterium]|nr:PQQ-like beta-propeller repeat protein [Verrucomicrobiae bacterium]